jgi:thiosulfate reductase cytochrome b subunit
MEPTPWHITIALLGGLGYLLVACTLTTLAVRVRQERARHDLIIASRRRRKEYLEAIASRMRHTAEVE